MEGPRASGHRTCSSEQRDCLPTASFGRGGNCGEPTAKAGAHLKRDPSQSRGLPQGEGQESSLLPDFGDPTNGVAFPEGIQCSEFFNAALQVAAHQGPFAAFLKRSLVPIRADAGPAARSDLWFCPPPCWGRWIPLEKLSPRRRKKHRFLRVRARALQHLVVALNWLTLGQTMFPPESARRGFPMSQPQLDMLES